MHMYRNHGAILKPTCALHAPFINHNFHLPADLRRRKKELAQTGTKHYEHNPVVLTKQTTRAQCMRL